MISIIQLIIPLGLFSTSQSFFYLTFPHIAGSLLDFECSHAGICGKVGENRLAWLIFYCSLSISIPSIFATGIYGKIGDKFGCRVTMLLPSIGQVLYILSLLVSQILFRWNISHSNMLTNVLVFGAFVSGMCGSRSTFLMSVFTFAAQNSTDSSDTRSKIFGDLDATLYGASITSPILVTLLLLVPGNSSLILITSNLLLAIGAVVSILLLIPSGIITQASPAIKESIVVGADIDQVELISADVRTPVMSPKLFVDRSSPQSTHSFADYSTSPSPPASPTTLTALRGCIVNRHVFSTSPGDSSGINLSTHADSESRSLSWQDFDIFITLKQLLNLFADKHFMSKQQDQSETNWVPAMYYPLPFVAVSYFLFHACSLGDYLTRVLYLRSELNFSQEQLDIFSGVGGVLYIISIVIVPQLFDVLLFSPQAISRYGESTNFIENNNNIRVSSSSTTIASRQFEYSLSITKDIQWLFVALTARIVYYALFGVCRTGSQLATLMPVLLACGLVVPRMKSLISKAVPVGAVADVFVALSALEIIGDVLAPAFTAVFALTTTGTMDAWWFPGLTFELVSITCFICLLIMLRGNARYVNNIQAHYRMPHLAAVPISVSGWLYQCIVGLNSLLALISNAICGSLCLVRRSTGYEAISEAV